MKLCVRLSWLQRRIATKILKVPSHRNTLILDSQHAFQVKFIANTFLGRIPHISFNSLLNFFSPSVEDPRRGLHYTELNLQFPRFPVIMWTIWLIICLSDPRLPHLQPTCQEIFFSLIIPKASRYWKRGAKGDGDKARRWRRCSSNNRFAHHPLLDKTHTPKQRLMSHSNLSFPGMITTGRRSLVNGSSAASPYIKSRR